MCCLRAHMDTIGCIVTVTTTEQVSLYQPGDEASTAVYGNDPAYLIVNMGGYLPM